MLEIAGSNVSTTYLTCPADPKQTLGIKLPFLVMIIKNVSGHGVALVSLGMFAGRSAFLLCLCVEDASLSSTYVIVSLINIIY